MELPDSSRFDLTGDLRICRVLNGMWQVSGAHGRIDPGAAVQAMFLYQDSGFTTWDLADHYGPAEDFIGEFRRRLLAERGEEGFPSFQALHQVGAVSGTHDPADCREQSRHIPAADGMSKTST